MVLNKMGNSNIVYLAILVTASICLQSRLGDAFNIEITPDEVNGLVQEEVKIRCSLDKTETNILRIELLEISKGETPVAILREKSGISIGKELTAKVQAHGEITRGINDSYIEVTLSNPGTSDAGTYTCAMYYLNQISVLKEVRHSAELIVSSFVFDMTIVPSTMNGFLPKETHMSCGIKQPMIDVKEIVMLQLQKEDVPFIILHPNSAISYGKGIESSFTANGNLSTSSNESHIHVTMPRPKVQDSGTYKCVLFFLDQTGHLRQSSKSATLTVSNDDIESTLTFLVSQVATLRAKESFTTAFSVEQPTTSEFNPGDTILFTQVQMNIGNHYDVTTGIYTAPRQGLYTFNLLAASTKPKWITQIELKVNDKTVSSMYTNDDTYMQQGYISTVVSLNTGDIVKPVSKTGVSTHLQLDEQRTIFNGYLIKLV